jgi:hypothetical protein
LKARELLVEFYSIEDDKAAQFDYDDTRRPRLTLRHLQKLRKAKDAEMLDKAEHLAFVPTMYGAQPDAEGM